MIVDYDRNRIAEVVNGKTVQAMKDHLDYIPGRERVREVTIDKLRFLKIFLFRKNVFSHEYTKQMNFIFLLEYALMRSGMHPANKTEKQRDT